MRFILVRHPETEANKRKLIYGWTESEYSEKGEKQFDKVIESLKDEKIDIAFCSPLLRARKLGEALAKEHELNCTIVEDLKEMNFGIFENMAYDEIQNKYSKQWDELLSNYKEYKIPDGESAEEVYNRATKFIEGIKGSGNTCLIVAHGMVVKFLIAYFLGLEIVESWRFRINPATVVDIVCKEDFNYIQGIIPTKV